MSELTIKPAVELMELLRRRTISSAELVAEHIREVDRLDGRLHAFAHFDPEGALRQARARDQAGGKDGALSGLPMTVKSSISTAGLRCEIGSVLNRGFVAERDAVAVTRLRAAGGVVLGTTNCPEFLMAYETDNLLYGRTANPWSLQHTAGGSSGGEAAAIAAGLSAGGLGSDSGGSVREPAHFTGICSLKPTPGRIPSEGHLPPCVGPFSILGAIGPMARTMEDVSLFFRVLSGSDAADPAGAPLPSQAVSEKELRGKPIGVLEDDGLVPITPETREAVRAAAKSFEEQGFRVEPFQSASLERARQLWWTFFMRCGRMLLEPLLTGREEELSSTFSYFLEVTRQEPLLTGEELLNAWTGCDRVRSLLLKEMAPYSALLTPVCSVPAFLHGEQTWWVEGQLLEYFSAMRFMQWFNCLGAPAAVVPTRRSRAGLPIGVQIAGRPYHDEEVLWIAGLLDRDFGYQAPPLAIADRVE